LPDVEWLDAAGFASVRDEWEALAERRRIPFVRHAWLRAWWDVFGEGELRVCTVREDGRLAAALPLRAANEHTPLCGALGDGAALAALADAVASACRSVELPSLAADDPFAAALADAARRHGRIVLREQHLTQPVVELPDDFDAYLRSIPKNLRKDSARRRRRLEEEHAVTFDLVAAPDDVDAELTRGFAVEQRSWKGRRGTAIAADPRTERFYREVGRAFAAEGRLRLSRLVVDGQEVAFDFCVLDHGRLWSLKFGFDEAYGRFGPGNVLTLAEIERCCELGLDALELLGDAEPWKQRFAQSTRPLVNVRAYSRRPLPLARYAYRRLLRPTARRVYRSAIAPRLNGRSRTPSP
jgi:CelD/BcsL family acetyltransferase involved in cellulose biosynthesis